MPHMLKIKLFRYGKRNQPHYRIVVSETRAKCGGKYIDLLGTYNPGTAPSTLTLDVEKYTNWISKGAQPTATVNALANKAKTV
jgi:small subunit ribosomal protein S16